MSNDRLVEFESLRESFQYVLLDESDASEWYQ